MGKKLFFLLCFFSLTAGIAFATYNPNLFKSYLAPTQQQLKNFTRSLIAPLQKADQFTPPPLRGSLSVSGANLDKVAILKETNKERDQRQLPLLKEHHRLDQAAQKKLKDMFAKQYFEHVSPDSTTPAELVSQTSYQYLIIGENLALGNFESEAALVTAWMESPGHRANILNKNFSEIGLAVGKGIFEEHPAWLAVQIFSIPASACPDPSNEIQGQFDSQKEKQTRLKSSIKKQKASLEQRSAELKTLSEQINDLYEEGNNKIKQGNAKIDQGNAVYKETGSAKQAQPYWDEGHALQEEGQNIISTAKEKQSSYDKQLSNLTKTQEAVNQDINSYNDLGEQIKSLAKKLNQQIKDYNNCLQSLGLAS